MSNDGWVVGKQPSTARNKERALTRLLIPALFALLVSGSVWGEDVAICTGTL